MSICESQTIQQTLFLGCSIASFNSQGGLNEQPSEVNVVVVQDDCAGQSRVYYNTNLERVTTTEADPGFIGEVVPIVGCPVYFRFGDFEFNGIVQSWEKENSTSAKNVYSVKLVTPIKVLQNTNIIIGEYSGPVGENQLFFSEAPNNLINVYGFAESIGGISAPFMSQVSPGLYDFGDLGIDGAVFGTAAGGFGGAGTNSNGMQWNLIKNVFSVLTSAVPSVSNVWSPHGRITHKGTLLSSYGSPWVNGYGLLPADRVVNARAVSEYLIDLTEVPNVPSYFRFSGVSVNLLEAISRVMQESGYDYYIEMITLRNQFIASSSGIAKIIKVRLISRLSQPSFGQIQQYIDTVTAEGENVVGSSVGREFRDDITSTFLIGGPKQTIYQAYQTDDPENDGNPAAPEDDDMILPYFGKYDNGNMIVPYLVTGLSFAAEVGQTGYFWQFDADTTAINLTLNELTLDNPLVINEKELLFATSMETWENYIKAHRTNSYESIENELPESAIDTDKAITLMDALYDNDKISHREALSWEMAYKDITNATLRRRMEDKEKVYQFISNFASQYYGKQFAVRVPYTAVVQDPESLQKVFSELPTNDGGWTETPDVIGLPNGTYYTDFFSDDKGKLGTIVAFSGAAGFDLSLFNIDDYITYNNILYIKGNVEEEYVFHNKTGYQVPRVVVTIPNVVWDAEDSDSTMYSRIHAARKNMKWIFPPPANIDEKIELFTNIYTSVGAAHVYQEYGRAVYLPDYVAIPMISNVNNYGPWMSVGPAGGIRVEKNDGLVPWEFGGYSILNTAAQELADAGVTNTQVIEMGSVTIAGYPKLPLGAEINSSSALQNKHLIENRSPSYNAYNGTFVGGTPFTYQYLNYNYGVNWVGTYGPNITNVSIQGGANITTTYSMRTYTPSFGKFAELNAQRLSQIGRNKIQIDRDIRKRQFKATRSRQGIGGNENEVFNSIVNQSKAIRKALEGRTPHELIVGEILSWRSGTRAIIANESIREAIGEMNTGTYERKAFMSLDGLLRPVSLNGRGGLPRFINATGSGVTTNTNQIYLATTGFEVTGLATGTSSTLITVRDLNPLSNPAGYAWSELAGRHSGNQGHDIDIVGRGTGVPTGGMVLRHHNNGSGFDYRDDYSFFALRGPMVLQSWGYDTEGKPVPNESDSESGCSGGIFKTSGLTDRFLPDWLQKSHTWPVAPIDFRLDKGRGVWTLSNSEPTLYCRLLNHLTAGAPTPAFILDSGTYYYESGTSGQVTGYSVISGWTETKNLWASGTDIKFKYDTRLGRWEAASDSITPILITGTITGATWDRNVTGIIPTMFVVPTFGLWTNPSGSNSGILMYRTGIMVTGWNRYTEQFDVTPGSAYIGKLINGWLEGAECNSVTL